MNDLKALLVERVQGTYLPKALDKKYKSIREAHHINEIDLNAPISNLY